MAEQMLVIVFLFHLIFRMSIQAGLPRRSKMIQRQSMVLDSLQRSFVKLSSDIVVSLALAHLESLGIMFGATSEIGDPLKRMQSKGTSIFVQTAMCCSSLFSNLKLM